MTNALASIVTYGGHIVLTAVEEDTANISEYLDLGFYDQLWFKDNTEMSLFDIGRLSNFPQRVSRLMCYHVFTQRGT